MKNPNIALYEVVKTRFRLWKYFKIWGVWTIILKWCGFWNIQIFFNQHFLFTVDTQQVTRDEPWIFIFDFFNIHFPVLASLLEEVSAARALVFSIGTRPWLFLLRCLCCQTYRNYCIVTQRKISSSQQFTSIMWSQY